MECSACKATIPAGSTWCIFCGVSLQAPAEMAPDDQRRAALANAECLRARGAFHTAITVYSQLLHETPVAEDAPVYELLGDTLRAQGNVSAAVKTYQRAVALLPTDENRVKLDSTLDQLHLPPPTGDASIRRFPRLPSGFAAWLRKISLLSRVAEKQFFEGEELFPESWLTNFTGWLTPRGATAFISLAFCLLILSFILTTRPYMKLAQPPQHITPVTHTARSAEEREAAAKETERRVRPADAASFQPSFKLFRTRETPTQRPEQHRKRTDR